jgi:hypothetical protein
LAHTNAAATVELTSPYTRTAIGPVVDYHLLKFNHDFGRLHGMRAGPNLQVNVGLGNAQLLKENVRHILVVMLAGMHQQLLTCGYFSSAAITGAAFIKFGRAPTTCKNFIGDLFATNYTNGHEFFISYSC